MGNVLRSTGNSPFRAGIPGSVTAIGGNAFYGCPRGLKVTVDRGSFAEKYCKENKLKRSY